MSRKDGVAGIVCLFHLASLHLRSRDPAFSVFNATSTYVFVGLVLVILPAMSVLVDQALYACGVELAG